MLINKKLLNIPIFSKELKILKNMFKLKKRLSPILKLLYLTQTKSNKSIKTLFNYSRN